MKMQLNTNVDTDTTTIFDEDGSLGIELAPRKHGGAIIKEIKEGGLAEKNGCLRKADLPRSMLLATRTRLLATPFIEVVAELTSLTPFAVRKWNEVFLCFAAFDP